jgi:hypothetical protein
MLRENQVLRGLEHSAEADVHGRQTSEMSNAAGSAPPLATIGSSNYQGLGGSPLPTVLVGKTKDIVLL